MAQTDFTNGIIATGLSADSAAFTLLGGRYLFSANATWGGGAATLKMLMPDGSTYVPCATALSADGSVVADLPAGTYKVAIATATAVQLAVSPVPYRPA